MAQSFTQDVMKVRPEDRLLLCCARTRLEARHSTEIKSLLEEEIDWKYLTGTAWRHAMLPLLYWHLSAMAPDAVPDAVLENLRKQFHANAERNVLLSRELLRLINLLQEHGILAVPLKGPIVAVTAYGDLSLRRFYDLDILVQRKDRRRAKELICSQEYHPHGLTEAQVTTLLEHNCELHLVREKGKDRFIVDLHWGVVNRPYPEITLEHLKDRLQPVCLLETTVLSLPLEELLVILCLHGSKHLWKRTEWIASVGEMIRAHPELDWERVVTQADEMKVRHMLAFGLLMVRDYVDAPVPEKVMTRVQADARVRAFAVRSRERLFSDVDLSSEVADKFLLSFYIRDHLPGRLRHIYDTAVWALRPSQKDRILLPRPAVFSPLRYVVRPIRLVREYGPALLKRFYCEARQRFVCR